MNVLKNIGGTLLGIGAFVGIIFALVLLFVFGTKIAFAIEPFVNAVAGVLFLIDVLFLVLAIIPKMRMASGIVLFGSSYVFGIATWIYGLAVTLSLWGFLALVIGLFLGGIGVVPIGLLAAVFHGRWDIFFSLLEMIIMIYGTRMIGLYLAEKDAGTHDENNVIDIEPERHWEDVA